MLCTTYLEDANFTFYKTSVSKINTVSFLSYVSLLRYNYLNNSGSGFQWKLIFNFSVPTKPTNFLCFSAKHLYSRQYNYALRLMFWLLQAGYFELPLLLNMSVAFILLTPMLLRQADATSRESFNTTSLYLQKVDIFVESSSFLVSV